MNTDASHEKSIEETPPIETSKSEENPIKEDNPIKEEVRSDPKPTRRRRTVKKSGKPEVQVQSIPAQQTLSLPPRLEIPIATPQEEQGSHSRNESSRKRKRGLTEKQKAALERGRQRRDENILRLREIREMEDAEQKEREIARFRQMIRDELGRNPPTRQRTPPPSPVKEVEYHADDEEGYYSDEESEEEEVYQRPSRPSLYGPRQQVLYSKIFM